MKHITHEYGLDYYRVHIFIGSIRLLYTLDELNKIVDDMEYIRDEMRYKQSLKVDENTDKSLL